jgi:uncharacterized protein (UPF0264 family)
MTRLLVSVRSGAEANEALVGGAHVIDAKEPQSGSLGKVSARRLVDIRQATAGRVILSAACGELLDDRDDDPESSNDSESSLSVLAGYHLAKVGLSRCAKFPDWQHRWSQFSSRLPKGVSLVAVAYADYRWACAPSPKAIIAGAAKLGCDWLLVDTFDKSRGHLFSHLSDGDLAEIMRGARKSGMHVTLAGSLTEETIPRAVQLEPDLIAVRGAACRGGRTGKISSELVRRIAQHLSTP